MDKYINKIIQGDCIEVMKTMPDKSVDLILTDPPYFLPAQHYNTRKQFRRNFSDLGILESFFKEFFNQLQRIMKEYGHFYIFCDGQSYPLFYYYSYFFTKSVRPLIWDKKTSINGYNWRHQHEIILYAEMPQAKPIPSGDGDILRYSAVKVEERKHPAQKPEDLLTKIISKHKAELVFDPFSGSGSTLVVAKKQGKKYIGIELNPDYINIANQRLAQEVLL